MYATSELLKGTLIGEKLFDFWPDSFCLNEVRCPLLLNRKVGLLVLIEGNIMFLQTYRLVNNFLALRLTQWR